METAEMGRVLTEATIENLGDLYLADRGLLSSDQVRRVTVSDALVDTGATALAMPTRLIQQLGLKKSYQKRATSTRGVSDIDVYEAVRLTIMGRHMSIDVTDVPDELPVRIGHIPLTYFDLAIDPRGRRLIGNPAHGGEHIFELL
jgi:predicted aspartyl protease